MAKDTGKNTQVIAEVSEKNSDASRVNEAFIDAANTEQEASAGNLADASAGKSTRLSHDDRRSEILQAVRELCSERGVARLSVSAISKRVGCTRSLFYHYFSDKEDAVAAAMDEAIDQIIERIEAWNQSRVQGDIEGALDSCAPLFIELVTSNSGLPTSFTQGGGSLYAGYLHKIASRVTQYICDSTVVDFASHHTIRIDHVYETFYVLIMGLLMYIRANPDVQPETVKDIIASTLHIEGYTAKYPERRPAD